MPARADGATLDAESHDAVVSFASTSLRRRSAAGLLLRVAALVVGAGTSLLIARSLGVSRFGDLSIAIALSNLVVQLADFGMTQAVTRLGSERPEDLGRIANAAATVAFLVTAAIAGIACAVGFLAYRGSTAIVIAVLLAVAPLASSGVLAGVGSARGRPDIGPLSSLLQMSTAGCASVAVALLAPSAAAFALAIAAATTLQAALLVRFATPHRFRPCLDRELALELLRYSWPIGVLGLFVTAYYRLDSVVVYAFGGSHALGLYAAGYRFIDAAQVIPAAIVAPLIPALVRALPRSQAEASQTMTVALRWAAIAGTGVAAIMVGSAPALLDVAFGPSYKGASLATALLGLAFIPICLGYVFTTACIATGRTARQIKLVAPLAVASIAVQLVLIPAFGIVAAAAVTAATEVCATAIAASRARTVAQICWRDIPWPSLSIAFASTAGAGLLTASTWSIATSCLAFVVVSVATNVVTWRDLRSKLGFAPVGAVVSS